MVLSGPPEPCRLRGPAAAAPARSPVRSRSSPRTAKRPARGIVRVPAWLAGGSRRTRAPRRRASKEAASASALIARWPEVALADPGAQVPAPRGPRHPEMCSAIVIAPADQPTSSQALSAPAQSLRSASISHQARQVPGLAEPRAIRSSPATPSARSTASRSQRSESRSHSSSAGGSCSRRRTQSDRNASNSGRPPSAVRSRSRSGCQKESRPDSARIAAKTAAARSSSGVVMYTLTTYRAPHSWTSSASTSSTSSCCPRSTSPAAIGRRSDSRIAREPA